MEVTHELLVKIRNEIDRRGHAKGRLEDDSGAVCLYGGFYLAAYGSATFPAKESSDGLLRACEDFAAALGFEKESLLTLAIAEAVDWNNAPERTKEEVLARLDEAIARTAPAPEDPLPTGIPEEATA